MTRALLSEPSASTVVEGAWELIARWKATPWITCGWTSRQCHRKSELKYLEEELELHPLAVQDALRHRHPPKLERFENELFIMVRGLSADSEGLDFDYIQISTFINAPLLVTRRRG
ncbi:MAG: magnesium transporter, partial [Gammaproteobacteria bacterium]